MRIETTETIIVKVGFLGTASEHYHRLAYQSGGWL